MKFLTFKRKHKSEKSELPASASCRNCGTELIERYCHHCGQDFFAGNEKTVGEILYNTMDTVFAWDNKILRTLKLLLFFPGRLTKEFLSGKVVRFVYPAKLFWFITILFFAVISFKNSDNKKIDTAETTETVSYIDKEEIKDTKEIGEISVPKKSNKRDPTDEMTENQVREKLFAYLPYVLFLLIPFFALLLFIFFHKKRKYYANHMIFALHFHSFVFLLFTLFVLVKDYIPDAWHTTFNIVILLLPPIYFVIALYVAYRPSIPKLIWKVPLIMITYGIVGTTILVLFVILVVWMHTTIIQDIMS